jgi:hypothetical protein
MSEDIVAKAEALYSKLDFDSIQPRQYWTYERYFDAAKMLPGLVAEVNRLKQLIDHTVSNFLQLQPGITWDGGIADAMKAAVEEIKRLRIENERAERAHESLRQLAAKDAEICILKTEACAAQKNIKRRDDDINGLMKELARWQQIAIKQRALINFIETEERYAYSEHVILSDDEISIAAKELGLQGYKTNGHIEINGERYVMESEQKAYVERLEEAFLDAYHAKIYYGRIYYKKDPGAREERIAETHAALEKIRMG